ncbi:MAG: T9SS type A sorting domain-containing protein [Paludibacteraceae bacterium]|nr:T9SS type A sorting domain-containing protein [Paludibacteraceae bacterium]
MKKIYLLLNFVLAFTVMSKAETSLFIDYLSGDDAEIALNVIGRIEIKDEVFRLISIEGTELASCNLYEVKKISFGDNSETNLENNGFNTIAIFPNPTHDVLFINGLNSNDIIRLFDLQGKLILTSIADVEGNLQMQVSQLPEGVYLLQVGVEIMKFIKQ